MVGPAKANLNDELQGAFSDMINVTPGGAYDTQRRGVISGGSISMRNKIVHPNLISWVPPEINGGCGGIDLFAGSFSFINGAQFTQLSRSIAQAAVGYAFELAIEGHVPDLCPGNQQAPKRGCKNKLINAQFLRDSKMGSR